MGIRKNQPPKLHLKKEDNVMVITGNDKGKQGRVLAVFPKSGRALVEGVKIVSRHTKPNQQNQQGGILKKEAPVDISNLMIIDPKSGEPTRIGRQRDKKGQLVRYAKKSGEVID
ncbi:MAG: 50S ribosomal protein L24 [Bacteroidetes bacterium SW_10_40_5]|nr:MAG: 50S ribosomal protein L24 [Bacteroidetes bacterium SW_10_40_5]